MFVKRHLGSLAAATGLVLAAFGVGGVANAADPFTLSSATFKDGTMMPKKVASKESEKYVGGKSTQGVGFFSGPCTPPGSPHHYTYMVIATDLDAKELPSGLTLPELQAKLNGHVKGAAGLVGLFVKPQ